MAERLADTIRFYELLDRLATQVGSPRLLQRCHAGMDWPPRGVYFFYESGEARSGTGAGERVVRIGAHGLTNGSRSTLWGRLSQHRGSSRSCGGNHRGSIFRLVVGIALAKRVKIPLPDSWGVGRSVSEAARKLNVDMSAVNEAEAGIEARVSEYIGQMPFLWLNVNDAPGSTSSRGLIERNAIALLSGCTGLPPTGRRQSGSATTATESGFVSPASGTITMSMKPTIHRFSMRWNRGLTRPISDLHWFQGYVR